MIFAAVFATALVAFAKSSTEVCVQPFTVDVDLSKVSQFNGKAKQKLRWLVLTPDIVLEDDALDIGYKGSIYVAYGGPCATTPSELVRNLEGAKLYYGDEGQDVVTVYPPTIDTVIELEGTDVPVAELDVKDLQLALSSDELTQSESGSYKSIFLVNVVGGQSSSRQLVKIFGISVEAQISDIPPATAPFEGTLAVQQEVGVRVHQRSRLVCQLCLNVIDRQIIQQWF